MTEVAISVLHVAETIKGGVGSYLAELLRTQRASLGRGAVSVIAPKSHLSQLEAPEGVEVIPFDDRRSRFENCVRIALSMRGFCRAKRIDIVHAHSAVAGVAARVFSWSGTRGVPIIYCAHGWAFDRTNSMSVTRLIGWLERILSYRAARIVCVSEFERESGQRIGIPAHRLITIPNGIASSPAHSTRKFDWPEGVLRVVFVGRFDRQKGVDIAAGALSRLQGHAFAYFIGEAVVGDQIAVTLPSNARALGWLERSDIASCLKTADVAIVPSRWEGFGLVAVEAMRAGTAVLAANVGGLPEIVQDGVTGLLLTPESPEAFAAALRSVDRDLLGRMGEAGRARFEARFTAESMEAALLQLYRNVLAESRP